MVNKYDTHTYKKNPVDVWWTVYTHSDTAKTLSLVLHDNNWVQWLILVHTCCLHIRSHIVHVLESVNEHSVVHTLVLLVTICDWSLVEDCFALWCADTCWLSVSFLFRVVSTCNEGRRLWFTVQASCYTLDKSKWINNKLMKRYDAKIYVYYWSCAHNWCV